MSGRVVVVKETLQEDEEEGRVLVAQPSCPPADRILSLLPQTPRDLTNSIPPLRLSIVGLRQISCGLCLACAFTLCPHTPWQPLERYMNRPPHQAGAYLEDRLS